MVKERKKFISLILLLVLVMLAVMVAGTSVSRYVFENEDNITGSFTNLYFSHDGENSSAIMYSTSRQGESGDEEIYQGYLSLNTFNYLAGVENAVSSRHIKFRVSGLVEDTTPNDNVADGNYVQDETSGTYYFTDMWGVRTELDTQIVENSQKYTVTPVRSDGSYYTKEDNTATDIFNSGKGVQVDGEGNVTLAFGSSVTESAPDPVSDTRHDMIELVRGGGEFSVPETIYIVIEIVEPYRELMFFTIQASQRLIAVSTDVFGGAPSSQYFGYDQVAVNIQTARSFDTTIDGSNQILSSCPVRITLTWSGTGSGVIFDTDRYITETEKNLERLETLPTDDNPQAWRYGWHVATEGGNTVVTLYLPQGSDTDLYFYVPAGFSCTITASFVNESGALLSYKEIAGAAENGLVVSI